MAELAGPHHTGPHSQVQEHVLDSGEEIRGNSSGETGEAIE